VTSIAASLIGPQFVREAGVSQELPGLSVVVLMNQDAAGQDAERALDVAHVLVQHQMMYVGAVEQGADGGDQHHVVGSDQFPQVRLPVGAVRGGCQAGATIVNRFVPLPL
jgi:hypothetical protein